jgi:hypothetical protein
MEYPPLAVSIFSAVEVRISGTSFRPWGRTHDVLGHEIPEHRFCMNHFGLSAQGSREVPGPPRGQARARHDLPLRAVRRHRFQVRARVQFAWRGPPRPPAFFVGGTSITVVIGSNSGCRPDASTLFGVCRRRLAADRFRLAIRHPCRVATRPVDCHR